MLYFLYSCVKKHIDSAPGLDRVLADWARYAPDAFDAILNSQKIWRFFAGLKLGSGLYARAILHSLGHGASMLFDIDMAAVVLGIT